MQSEKGHLQERQSTGFTGWQLAFFYLMAAVLLYLMLLSLWYLVQWERLTIPVMMLTVWWGSLMYRFEERFDN